MTDIATLGLAIDSRQAVTAKAALEGLAAASKVAEPATKALEKAVAAAGPALKAEADAGRAAGEALAAFNRGQQAGKQYADALKASLVNSTKAHSAHNNALGIGSTQFASLLHSGRGATEMLVQGISPTQILAMELNNLSYAMMGPQGLIAATAGARASFMAWLAGPWGQIAAVAALATVTVAAVFHEIKRGTVDTETALKNHKTLIDDITHSYDAADKAVKQYAGDSTAILQFKVNEDVRNLKTSLTSALSDVFAAIPVQRGPDRLGPLKSDVDNLRNQLRSGVIPDLAAFRDRIAEIANASGDSHVKDVAAHLLDVTSSAADLERELQKDTALQNLLFGGGPGAATNILRAKLVGRQIGLDHAKQINDLFSSDFDPWKSAIQLDKTLESSSASMAKQFADSIDAVRKQTVGLQSQLDTMGMASGAAATYTKRQELLNQAQLDHVALTPKVLASINSVAGEYGNLTERIGVATTMQNALFSLQQIGMTQIEQQVASTMRAIYGNDYLAHMNDAIAGQLRFNDTLSQTKELASGVLNGLLQDIRDGKSLAEDLNNAFNKIENKLFDIATNEIISGLFSKLLGGGGGGGIFSWLGGLFGGSAAGAGHAGVHHTGYGPGDSYATRAVNSAMFEHAPRYHTGIGPDERAAIIRNDESVLTPGQMRQLAPVGASTGAITVNVFNAPGGTQADTKVSRTADGGTRVDVMLKRMVDDSAAAAINSGESATNAALERRYGVRPKL